MSKHEVEYRRCLRSAQICATICSQEPRPENCRHSNVLGSVWSILKPSWTTEIYPISKPRHFPRKTGARGR